MDPILRYLLIAFAILVFGVGLFFASGLSFLKKNRVAIVYKAGRYYKTIFTGTHYFLPLLYKVSKSYRLGPQSHEIRLGKEKIILLTEIVDPRRYDEARASIEKTALDVYRHNHSVNKKSALRKALMEIGVKLDS